VRTAVLSDIHGNAVAFDAVLADLERRPVDRVICLGDAIQGGPQPAEVVARLRALGCPVVMGNADAFLLRGVETGHEDSSPERRTILHAVREWSVAQLSDADRAFIAAFPPTVTLALEGGSTMLGFHGSPDSFDQILMPDIPDEELRRALGPHAARHAALCGGHVHVQFVRQLGAAFHFNPGSVGAAYRHGQPEGTFRMDPWAEYATLELGADGLALAFHRVGFDVPALVEAYRSSGRPFADQSIRQY